MYAHAKKEATDNRISATELVETDLFELLFMREGGFEDLPMGFHWDVKLVLLEAVIS